MFRTHNFKIFIAIAVIGFLILPQVALAINLPPLVPSCALGEKDARGIYVQKTAPSLKCVELLLVNIAKWIFGISGAIALLMFIYGGFLWLTSGGAPGKIEDGRKIMVGTVVGLVIIFGANLGITAIQNALKGQLLPVSSGGGGEGTTENVGCCQEISSSGITCRDIRKQDCGVEEGAGEIWDERGCNDIPECKAGAGGESAGEMGCCGVSTPSTKANCSVNWTPGPCQAAGQSSSGCCSYIKLPIEGGGGECTMTTEKNCRDTYDGSFDDAKVCDTAVIPHMCVSK